MNKAKCSVYSLITVSVRMDTLLSPPWLWERLPGWAGFPLGGQSLRVQLLLPTFTGVGEDRNNGTGTGTRFLKEKFWFLLN